MSTATTSHSLPRRRLALAAGLFSLLLLAIVLGSPAARASAADLVRQIGAIIVAPANVAPPQEAVPTAEPPPAADQAIFAVSAGEASTAAGFAVLEPTWLPPGYEAAGGWSVIPQGQGVMVAREYGATGAEHFLILNQYKYGSDDRFDQSYGTNETMTELQVRGHLALAISDRLMAHPHKAGGGLVPTNWLMWEENGMNFSLFSDALTSDELLQIAESMQE